MQQPPYQPPQGPPQGQPYYQPPYYPQGQPPYQPQGSYTQPPSPMPPKKHKNRVIIWVIGILLLIVASRVLATVIAQDPKVSSTAAVATMPPLTAAPNKQTHPTQVPTHAAVPTTVAPTAVPTSPPAPTQVVVPTQPPAPMPTSPPVHTGVNGNPWGYDFTPGNEIYQPPADFCGQYFTCVTTFWKAANGYVAQCANGLFTHSGGVRGECSRDGGKGQILYSH